RRPPEPAGRARLEDVLVLRPAASGQRGRVQPVQPQRDPGAEHHVWSQLAAAAADPAGPARQVRIAIRLLTSRIPASTPTRRRARWGPPPEDLPPAPGPDTSPRRV